MSDRSEQAVASPPLPRQLEELHSFSALPDPYPVYRRLRAHSPVHWIPGTSTVVVSRYRDCVEVLRSPERFSSEAQGAVDPTLLGADPPAHTRIRRRLAKSFSLSEVSKLEPFVRSSVRELIRAMRGQPGEVDLVSCLSVPLPAIVMRQLLQIDASLTDRFARWAHAVATDANAMDPSRNDSSTSALRREFMQFLIREHFPRCSRPGGSGVVSELLAEDAGSRLAVHEVGSLVLLFAFAGIETTRNLINNCLLAFQRNPPVWERLVADPALLPRAIEEAIRFDAPVQIVQRTLRKDTELGGHPLFRGCSVVVLLGSANRDELQFADPDRLVIEREETNHIGFGGGPHFCLGSHLARLEARIALEELLRELPHLRIAPRGDAIPMTETYATRGPRELRVSC